MVLKLKLMVVVQLALITGSGKGGAIILRLGPAESDWNPFQLNVTNGYLWQLEKLHQMKSVRLQRHSGLLSVASSFSLCQACLPVRMVPDMWDGWWMNSLSLLNLVIFWCTLRSSINGGMQLFTHFTNWFLKENFSQLDFVTCYTVLFWLGLGQGQELWP